MSMANDADSNGQLRWIYSLANQACEAARDDPKAGSDAVNWGDIQCIDVERVESLFGQRCIRVIISEAAPDAWDFREFVEGYLGKCGHEVHVVTEW